MSVGATNSVQERTLSRSIKSIWKEF